MTTTSEVALEEFLLTHGPSKATVIAKALSYSETTTRKLLKSLADAGSVAKDGQLFAWVTTRKSKGESARHTRREDVQQRDAIVLGIIANLEPEVTISRNEILKALHKAGHKDLTGSFVYLSLYRLHASSDIEKVHVGRRAPEWRVAYAK